MDAVMIKGYVSHIIRGGKGAECSDEEMQANCAKATEDMSKLMAMLQRAGLPVLLYIPGANDQFVQLAYRAGRITEEEILATDCDIIDTCDFVLVYNWAQYISSGMQVELAHAADKDVPVLRVDQMDQITYFRLLSSLADMLVEKAERPNIIKIGG